MTDSNDSRTPIADAVASAEADLRGRVASAKEKVNDGYSRSREFLGDRMDRSREKLGEVSEDLRKRVDDVRERIANKDWGQLSEDVKSYVKDNPGKALVASVAAGFLLGILLRRDRD